MDLLRIGGQERGNENYLVRDFMGNNWFPPVRDIQSRVYLFHASWDWLIPVTIKVRDELAKIYALKGAELSLECTEHTLDIEFDIVAGQLEKCFENTVKAITWLNSLRK